MNIRVFFEPPTFRINLFCHSLVPINYIQGVIGYIQVAIAQSLKKSNDVAIKAKLTKKDDLLVVLAIGETARQKSFSLYGYDRKNTNPILSKIDGLYLLNGQANVGSTIYAISNILDRDDVKLVAVTSKVGINTSCYVNYTLYDNCDAVGEVAVENCSHKEKCYDEDTIPLFQKNLESYHSGYRFIILHLGGGSHGPDYQSRHPKEFQKFKPLCSSSDVVNRCTKEELYNSYDNTILYLDYILGKIIKKLDSSRKPYIFIYLSDHGESLLEKGNIFHGMPPGDPFTP